MFFVKYEGGFKLTPLPFPPEKATQKMPSLIRIKNPIEMPDNHSCVRCCNNDSRYPEKMSKEAMLMN